MSEHPYESLAVLPTGGMCMRQRASRQFGGAATLTPFHHQVAGSTTEEASFKHHTCQVRVKSQSCILLPHFLRSASGWNLHFASALLRLLAALTAFCHSIVVLVGRPFADGAGAVLRRGRDLRLLLQSIHIIATFLFVLCNAGFGGMSLNFLTAVKKRGVLNSVTRRYTYETQSIRLCLIVAVGYTTWLAMFSFVVAESSCYPLAAVFDGDTCARAKLVVLGLIPGVLGITGASLTGFLNTGRYFVCFNTLAYIRMALGWITIGASTAAQMLCHNILAFKPFYGESEFSEAARRQIRLFGDLCFLYGGSIGVLALIEGCVSIIAGWLRSKLQVVIEAVRNLVTLVALFAFGAGLIWTNDVHKFLSRWDVEDRGIRAFNSLSFKALVGILIAATVFLITCTVLAEVLSVSGLCVNRWRPREWSIKERLLHKPRRFSTCTVDGDATKNDHH